MKKLLLLSLMFAFSVVTAHAYVPKRKFKAKKANQTIMGNIKFGLNVGRTGSELLNDKDSSKDVNDKRVDRFHADIFGEYKFIEELGAQLALLYVGKGDKSQDSANKLHLNYLQSNATLRYYPGKDRQFCLLIGPYISYLITAKKLTKEAGETEYKESNLKEEATKDTIQNIDAGIVFGLDYEFDMALILGFDVNIGLKPIYKEREDTNFGVNLNLGYNFAKLLQ